MILLPMNIPKRIGKVRVTLKYLETTHLQTVSGMYLQGSLSCITVCWLLLACLYECSILHNLHLSWNKIDNISLGLRFSTLFANPSPHNLMLASLSSLVALQPQTMCTVAPPCNMPAAYLGFYACYLPHLHSYLLLKIPLKYFQRSLLSSLGRRSIPLMWTFIALSTSSTKLTHVTTY